MQTKILIPVIDTESGNYDYERNISNDEYSEMFVDNFNRTDKQINRYVNDLAHGVTLSSKIRSFGYEISNDRQKSVEDKYNFYEAEAFIQDSRRMDVGIDFFNEKIYDGKMFLLLVNVNPNSIDNDAESELRFWIDDSRKIHNDATLDDKTKMKALPSRQLKIKLGEEYAIMKGCKVLKDYSDRKYPFNFAIIVEKLIK